MEYMPTELCQSCQGACCKHMPGSYYPQDFKGRLSEIVKMLFEGKCEVAPVTFNTFEEVVLKR